MKRRTFLTAVPAFIAPTALPAIASDVEVAELSPYYRISVNERDPGYETYLRLMADGLRVKSVYCNGVKLRGIQTADAKEGWARGATYDAYGNIVFVKDLDEGLFPEQTHFGRIAFEFEKVGGRSFKFVEIP